MERPRIAYIGYFSVNSYLDLECTEMFVGLLKLPKPSLKDE